jgi:ABC-type glycerol-3-phosphate transport system substrate-binding protein
MKCIKKLVAIALAAVLALAMLTACSGGGAQLNAKLADDIAATINGVRSDSKKDALKRAPEVEALFAEAAKAAAIYAADKTTENGQKVKEAEINALSALKNIEIDGRKIDIEATRKFNTVSSDLKDVSQLKSVLESSGGWRNTFVLSNAEYLAVVCADYNGHNGIVMVGIVLESAE